MRISWHIPLVLASLALALLAAAYASRLPVALVWPTAEMRLPLAEAISRFTLWLTDSAAIGPLRLTDVTRALAALIDAPYQAVRVLLVDGITEGRGRRATMVVPPASWLALIVAVMALGHYAKGWGLALLSGALVFYLVVFGQWESAMVTLSSILIAVPLGVGTGLLLGIAAWRSPWLMRLLAPILDLMQTVPTFAYLVPVLVLFGFGPVAALLATMIYATPPMVRVTVLALRAVPAELLDFATMAGCTRGQSLRRVMLPVALPDLMLGVNQVIMLSLNMVIIASMIGAGGLGFDVLNSLRRLDIGGGIEAGIAITVLAILLDRLGRALAERPSGFGARERRGLLRYPRLTLVLCTLLVTSILSYLYPVLREWPKAWELSTKLFWSDLVKWININYFDQLEALKTLLLQGLMLPIKRFLLALPWPLVVAALTLLGARLGGWKLGLFTAMLSLFIASTGLWEQAMTTLYLCGLSVLIAALIGIPFGLWAALSPRAGRVIELFIDTLQTLPSFVYLIPVVMLFRVGDFSAMIAVVLYALVPFVRYTAHGIRATSPELIEAGLVAGCTPWQILRKIRLPMAVPMLLLGLNQAILLALSMLVITALVGTRDLGQEVYIALTRADVGGGVVAGLAVAAIAMIADRMIGAYTARAKARLEVQS